ncbi:MAG TPA: aspartate/glutamate racemase family protein [Nitrososphaerales archaeon]|nr:aspartate/glutamate racemase family protein [Nitrososphaerales archaeon]
MAEMSTTMRTSNPNRKFDVGSIKRIGMIYPAAGRSEKEFEILAPPEVAVHVTRIKWTKEDKQQLLAMENYLADTSLLLASARVDLILFNCTTCSLVKGYGYDRKLIDLIEKTTGIPAMTTATAAVLALNHLGLRNITLLTAYPQEMNDIEAQFLNDHGIKTSNVDGAGITDPFEQYSRDPSFWYQFCIENYEKSTQGLFLSCAGIRVADVLQEIEDSLGVPVVASNQAAMWACLSKLGITSRVEGYGKLLSEIG